MTLKMSNTIELVELAPGPVRELFTALNASKVPYVVLRGYLPLAELEASADIDVLIATDGLGRLEAPLRKIGWASRRVQVGRYPHHFIDCLGHGDRFVTMFDTVTDLCYGPLLHRLEPAEVVLKRAEMKGGVRVPHPWHSFFLLVLHQLLDKSELLPHHTARLREHAALCLKTRDGHGVIGADFGSSALELTSEALRALRVDDFELLLGLRERARELPVLKSQRLRAEVGRWRSRIRQRMARPVRIAMIGLDGSGKSTLVEQFLRSASTIPAGTGYLGHNLFSTRLFIWILRRLNELAVEPGESARFKGRFLSVLSEFVWPFEILSRMRKAERGRLLVLYDRFPLPGLDPTGRASRFRRLVRVVTGLLRRIIPDPDVVLFLDGDAEVIWARKKEYPLEVFLEAQDRYRRAVAAMPFEVHVIRTDRCVQDSLREMISVLSASPRVRSRLLKE